MSTEELQYDEADLAQNTSETPNTFEFCQEFAFLKNKPHYYSMT